MRLTPFVGSLFGQWDHFREFKQMPRYTRLASNSLSCGCIYHNSDLPNSVRSLPFGYCQEAFESVGNHGEIIAAKIFDIYF
jgi:hypothetical protein